MYTTLYALCILYNCMYVYVSMYTHRFVNFSPADYNCDETVSSLAYAARVKKITNNAARVSILPFYITCIIRYVTGI